MLTPGGHSGLRSGQSDKWVVVVAFSMGGCDGLSE